MKVDIKRPNITQYHFVFEPTDEIYTSCMWARVNLDNDNFTMTATSDCGDYSYRWQVTDHETFTSLMSRIDREYLLNKISSRSIFDFEESKEEAIRMAKLYDSDADIVGDLRSIDCMEYGTEESFFRRVEEITDWGWARC